MKRTDTVNLSRNQLVVKLVQSENALAAKERCINNAIRNLSLFRCRKCGDLAEIVLKQEICPTCDLGR
jgi:rubrerythrin